MRHIIAVLLIGLASCASQSGPQRQMFATGQMWSIKSTSPTTAKVVIGRIEPWGDKIAVHVSIVDVPIPSGESGAGGTTSIHHMPFEQSAFSSSVERLVATERLPAAEFQSAYDYWKAQQGGIFTIGISDAIALTFEIMRRSRQPRV